MKIRVLLGFCLLLCFSCSNKPQKTKIVLNLKAGLGEHVYISRIAFNDEKQINVDSAVVTDNHYPIILYVPAMEERLYQIRITNSNMRIMFVNDAPEITIDASWFNNKYKVAGSAATTKLNRYQTAQLQLAEQLKKIDTQMRSSGVVYKQTDTNHLVKAFNKKLAEMTIRSMNYADTVTDPVLFMIVYNGTDFGNDRAKLKQVTRNAASRFPGYEPVQTLEKNLLRYLSIYENRFKIGDKLPWITLPDTTGRAVSTSIFKGKYYLLSFWSTFCTECRLYGLEEVKLKKTAPSEKFALVTVALDDQKEAWKQIIKKENYNWTQLIDEKMWNGTAVTALKVDTIPSNYFVSPTGRIIGINIPVNQLYKTVYDSLKNAK